MCRLLHWNSSVNCWWWLTQWILWCKAGNTVTPPTKWWFTHKKVYKREIISTPEVIKTSWSFGSWASILSALLFQVLSRATITATYSSLLLICSVLLLVAVCSAGSSFSDQVVQTPADICTKGEDAKIDCSHNIPNYNRIFWYKQSKSHLQLLGYLFIDQSYPEPGVNVMMDGNANQGRESSLTIKEIDLNSSGVYFCAAGYHSAAHHCTSIQKPFLISALQLPPPCTWNQPQ